MLCSISLFVPLWSFHVSILFTILFSKIFLVEHLWCLRFVHFAVEFFEPSSIRSAIICRVVSLVLPLPDPSKPEQHEACCPLGKRVHKFYDANLLEVRRFNIHINFHNGRVIIPSLNSMRRWFGIETWAIFMMMNRTVDLCFFFDVALNGLLVLSFFLFFLMHNT